MRRLPASVSAFLVAIAMTLPVGASPGPGAGDRPRTALVIHGGAGVITREDLSAADEASIRADLDRALDAGDAVLKAGGAALDAAVAAVRVLEDSPWFNAGKGAVFTADGTHELDAAVMEGHTRRAGAVAGVRTVRHPVLLARAVMDHSPHVFLAAGGAESFADTRPELERVPNAWFDTERRRLQLEAAREREQRQAAGESVDLRGAYFGTVGAVALDADGHIAAATSTGGMTNKRCGRIGDAPVIGAGTYATDRCGVSATGWGEFYLRAVAAHDVCARVELRGDPIEVAAEDVINRIIPAMGGDGGAIGLDDAGTIVMPFNTSGMYRGWIHPDGRRGTAVFRDAE
ncbi:MAG: isoaspartyl peptidase/L-asparaginase family protein [Lysobacteraceae bacterium]